MTPNRDTARAALERIAAQFDGIDLDAIAETVSARFPDMIPAPSILPPAMPDTRTMRAVEAADWMDSDADTWGLA